MSQTTVHLFSTEKKEKKGEIYRRKSFSSVLF